MNIGMLLDNEFTGDLRVENEVLSLVNAGHSVYVLCFNHGDKKELEDYHGATIIRLSISKFKKNKMKGFTNTIFDLYTPYWTRNAIKLVNKYQIDAIHVHDLYLLGAAFLMNKKLKMEIPVIGDLHENYPEALKHYKFTQVFPGKYVISIPKWFETEKNWIEKADYIITVIEEATERYSKIGLDRNKITVVPNYVSSELFLKSYKQSSYVKKVNNFFSLLYVGGFDLHRGLECSIKSIALLKNKIPNIKLVLVGSGSNLNELKKLATDLEVMEHISFEGWQKPETLPKYIENSSICLIPHLKTEHTDNTIPHKLFQYMLLEKAVLSSNCKPIERILKDTASGVVFNSNDEESMAEQILFLHKNQEETSKMGLNGKKAVVKTYNWDSAANELVALYKRIEGTLN